MILKDDVLKTGGEIMDWYQGLLPMFKPYLFGMLSLTILIVVALIFSLVFGPVEQMSGSVGEPGIPAITDAACDTGTCT